MSTNKFLLTSLAVTSMAFFNGCGGGSSTNGTTTTSITHQPHQLSARDFQNVDVLTPPSIPEIPAPKVTDDTHSITITYYGSELAPFEHNQFFLNIDNNADTGFRFDGKAWDNAGTDYIVEDGHLFKSTSNDSSWSWNENVGEIIYKRTPTSVSATIEKTLLQGLTSIIRVGLVKRDDQWKVLNFYPQSSQMAEYTINVPPAGTDTVAPDIKMNGASYIEIRKGTVFTDPGATAKDDVDGDITASITVETNLDINKLGTYKIIYRVSDAAGNASDSTRTVKVITDTPADIIVDGNKSDWADKTAISVGHGILKAYDTNDKIFILFDASDEVPVIENTQIFLDVDNDASTGFQFNGSIWNNGGADYMIENDHLDKAKGNNSSWAWDYNISPIEYAKGYNVVEVAIPKSVLANLGSTINIGFVGRNEDWTIDLQAISTGLADYQLESTAPVQTRLALLPNFCDSELWETRGTPETTQISPFSNRNNDNNLIIKHNGEWYGTWETTNASTGEIEIDIVRYDGVHTRQFLPLYIVREEPLGDDKITDMAFIGDTLYFVFGNELWSTDGTGSNSHIVKKFGGKKIRKLYPSKNFVAVHVTEDFVNNETWIMNNRTSTSSEQVFKVEVGNAKPIFTDLVNNTVYLQGSDGYYKTDYTHFNEKLDYIPLTSHEDKLYLAKPDTNSEMYSLFESTNSNSILTKIKTFIGAPRVKGLSSENSFYLSLRNSSTDDRKRDIWRLDFSDNKMTNIRSDIYPFPSSSSSRLRTVLNIHNTDYVIIYHGRFTNVTLNKADGTRVAVLASLRPDVDRHRTTNYKVVNGNLYFTHVKQDGTASIGVINGSSATIKELASCN